MLAVTTAAADMLCCVVLCHAVLRCGLLPQANIYSPERTFYSFKQVVRELQSTCPLVSLHSTSKVRNYLDRVRVCARGREGACGCKLRTCGGNSLSQLQQQTGRVK